MNEITSPLQTIKSQIATTAALSGRDSDAIKLLAATKNQPPEKIEELILEGQQFFGENRVQEAVTKWQSLKKIYPACTLHLIGHLQTNKVKEAVELFDVIETLDSVKLADKLSLEEGRQKKKLTYYIEINIAAEPQKSGILPQEFPNFFGKITQNYPLHIKGLMCIPPANTDPSIYFQQMTQLAKQFKLPELSMGMSDDYELAIKYGATEIRIGRGLFRS